MFRGRTNRCARPVQLERPPIYYDTVNNDTDNNDNHHGNYKDRYINNNNHHGSTNIA